MPLATMTNKGRLTLPKPIRELLKLKPGDAVDFVVAGNGTVEIRVATFDVRNLRDLLKKPGRKPVSVRVMDDALKSRASFQVL